MIPVASPDIGELEARYVREAVESGWVSSIGEFIGRFESGVAALCEVPHAIAVSNGTDALFLALRALGVGPGDEVILPDLTFAAVPAAVVHAGATPVLADVRPDYWCLDPQAVEQAITPRTRAIIAVHLYGHPADLDALLELARPHGIPVIEDCAEAHGARYRGRLVGGIGTVGTFSFYGNKILTTGEGGAITTHDPELASRIRFIKDHAMDPARRYFHSEVGHNCRMTNLQAALGCAQLERFAELEQARRDVLAAYSERLPVDAGLSLNPAMEWAEPAVWLVCALLDEDRAGQRDGILRRLRTAGVDTRPFFIPMHELPPYSGCRLVSTSNVPVSRRLADSGFNLPSGHGLGRDDITVVVDALLRELAAA